MSLGVGSVFSPPRPFNETNGFLISVITGIISYLGRGTPNEFKEALTGRINQQDLEKELENPPKENEVIVLLYTLEGEYITSFKETSDNFEYDCDECYETFTFGETIQADPNDEWIRCCSNCIELRS